MKHTKILILLFGVLGGISLFIPMEQLTFFELYRAMGIGYLAPVLGGFVLAAVMGGMGVTKPPMQQWQAGAAAAGFALVFVRLRFWKVFDGIAESPLAMKLMIAAVLGGLVTSILAIVKPEAKA